MSGNVASMFFIILLVILALMVIAIWAIGDAASRSESAFVAAGLSKYTWLALLSVFTLFGGPIGVGLDIYYLVKIRPRLAK